MKGIYMRIIKVLAITATIAVAMFFVLNYYLPAVTGEAMEQNAVGDRHATTLVVARDDNASKSIADELGICILGR